MTVTLEMHEERPIGISLPDQVTLEVTETEPTIKGQTAASSYKPALLENGVRVMVPPFVSARRADRRRHQRDRLRPPRRIGEETVARSAILNVMVAAATKAARGLRRDFGEVENLQVSRKGPADFVSAADKRAEAVIHAELMRARPSYGFLMEESGETKGSDPQHRWIVDPLDGTTNFLHGIPQFAISIALERQGRLHAALVYDPIAEELFTAERGGGAFLNDRRLRVAARQNLADCVIATGMPFMGHGDHARFMRELGAIMPNVAGFGVSGRRRSISPGSRRADSTASGSTHFTPGTSPPESSSSARRAAS